MSRAKGRRELFNKAQATARLGYARKCYELGVLGGEEPEDTYAAKVAVTLYVLAGIASADAICGMRIGERWRGEDHRGAVILLDEAVPKQQLGKLLASLLDLKDKAQYSPALIRAAEETRARRVSEQLIAHAATALRG